jgi:hypothetical protein
LYQMNFEVFNPCSLILFSIFRPTPTTIKSNQTMCNNNPQQ